MVSTYRDSRHPDDPKCSAWPVGLLCSSLRFPLSAGVSTQARNCLGRLATHRLARHHRIVSEQAYLQLIGDPNGPYVVTRRHPVATGRLHPIPSGRGSSSARERADLEGSTEFPHSHQRSPRSMPARDTSRSLNFARDTPSDLDARRHSGFWWRALAPPMHRLELVRVPLARHAIPR